MVGPHRRMISNVTCKCCLRASGGSASTQTPPKPLFFGSSGHEADGDQPAPVDTGIFIARDNPRRFFVREPLPSTQSAQASEPSQNLRQSGQNGHDHAQEDESEDRLSQPSRVSCIAHAHVVELPIKIERPIISNVLLGQECGRREVACTISFAA